MSKKLGLGKLFAGVALGAGLGLLFAPKTGKETRADLKKVMDDLLAKIDEIDVDEVKKEFTNKVEVIKKELEGLDKEKALKIAKQKAKELQVKVEELSKYAVEKGTPVVEQAAQTLKEKTLAVAKDVVSKLETKE